MALNKNKNLKRYFTIKEVAQKLDVTESTLRYWEKEFSILRPKIQEGTKIRLYTEQNMEQIKLIYNLIKVRGFKIAAAKKMLSANRSGVEKTAVVLEKLMSVRRCSSTPLRSGAWDCCPAGSWHTAQTWGFTAFGRH